MINNEIREAAEAYFTEIQRDNELNDQFDGPIPSDADIQARYPLRLDRIHPDQGQQDMDINNIDVSSEVRDQEYYM